MAHNNLLETSTVSMSELLGNGRIYRVPPFQRDYAWREREWEDLWEDITQVEGPAGLHYMGTVVLQPKADSKEYAVIDGQQRLTTLSLIAIAVIDHLQRMASDLAAADPVQSDSNKERAEILRRTFLGDKDPKSLLYSSKLFLNGNNNDFYQSYLLQLRPPPVPARLSDTNKLLWSAYKYFHAQVGGWLAAGLGPRGGEALTGFLTDVVASRLLFIQIQVQDELSAYTVFETLNSSGVGLTSTDLLKNYLFSLVPSGDVALVQQQWQRIAGIIGTDKLPEFFRHYLNSLQPLIRAERLFRSVKDSVRNGQEALAFLDDLELGADCYAALFDPSHSLWREDKAARHFVRVLRELRVRQIAPLLLAVLRHFTPIEVRRSLHLAIVVSVRFHLIGNANPNELERVYNDAAMAVHDGRATTVAHLGQLLRSIYVDDAKFAQDFTVAELNLARRKKLVRYLLYTLEEQAGGGRKDFEEDPGTIEHILPLKPSTDWDGEFPPDLHETYVHRLGNYLLLEENLNGRLGNRPYSDKLPIYRQSHYVTTSNLSAPEWTRLTLLQRQEHMADLAVQVWNINRV